MQAYFDQFTISMTLEQAKSASHQGQCDADVAELLRAPTIRRQFRKIDPDYIRRELSGYGAWDDEELADNAQNQHRILWIAASNLVEEKWRK